MPATIRTATLADAEAVARVHVTAWRRGYAGLLPQGYLDGLSVAERAERWRGILSADQPTGATTLVAEISGKIRGFATVGPSRDDGSCDELGELWAIYVDPARWGSGVGHRLHSECVGLLRDAGWSEATLWVLRGNRRAVRFYERQGWTADGATKTDWRPGVRLDEERYRLRLPPQ